jgi:hypothetical protein
VDKFCKKIHFSKGDVCWYHMFDNTCKFGNKCSNKHSLRYCELIQTRGLNRLNDFTLRNLLRLSKQFEIKFCKSIETCSSFNCVSLHCCFHYYVHDDCIKKQNECVYGHNFDVHLDHNLKVLSKRNLDGYLENDDDIKTYLISAYFGIKKKRKNSLQFTCNESLDTSKIDILHEILLFMTRNNTFHVEFDELCCKIQRNSKEVKNFINKDQHNFLLFDRFDATQILQFIPVSL